MIIDPFPPAFQIRSVNQDKTLILGRSSIGVNNKLANSQAKINAGLPDRLAHYNIRRMQANGI
jgi:hypothetical protein